MRPVLYLAAIVAAAACGSQPRPAYPSSPVRYSCGDATVTRHGEEAVIDREQSTGKLLWTDGAGDHFVFYASDRAIVVELVAPADPSQGATRNVYDVSRATGQSDWLLLGHESCASRSSGVLARNASTP